ncbi:NAD(P)-dependent oxidoreductase [Halioxenophilus sp. WMMB6]|uniref:NAD(P)-dependent oxidoreductase n=1 Tax=Halioxenophilus sp. WMMB6 TaxID=3073815 RepID=UPI00295E334D|nr:NAD(P)-dependent oxidoreductase [Halioxenophilus sp. WMMB6]
MKYGFIGLGSQGAPMAQRMIDAGLEVVLWARRPETLAPFADSSATRASTIVELAEQVSYCAVCVVDDAGVEQVVRQLLQGMAPGGTIVIHSTVHPQLCRDLAERAKNLDIAVLDAPVSGGGGGAANGTLTVMLGGDADSVAAVKPVLETFAGLIAHLGGVGAGQLAKLVNNSLMAANLALADHALAAAEALGVESAAFKQLVAVSSGRSFAFDVRARMNQPSDFLHGAQLLAKDVRLLGDALMHSRDFTVLKNTAQDFLDRALDQ